MQCGNNSDVDSHRLDLASLVSVAVMIVLLLKVLILQRLKTTNVSSVESPLPLLVSLMMIHRIFSKSFLAQLHLLIIIVTQLTIPLNPIMNRVLSRFSRKVLTLISIQAFMNTKRHHFQFLISPQPPTAA
jgi:hypothetical protein